MPSAPRSLVVAAIVGALAVGVYASRSPRITQPEQSRLAVVDVFGITERLLAAPPYAGDLQSEEDRITAELETMRQQLTDAIGNIEAAGEAEKQGLLEEAQAMQQNFQQAREDAVASYDAFRGQKLLEAYERVVRSARAAADELGYTHVLATRPQAPDAEQINVQTVAQYMLANPVVVVSDADVIDARVIADLGLEEAEAPAETDPDQ